MKFGRKSASYTRRTMRSALVMANALNVLGPAPLVTPNDWRIAVNNATGGDWGMMGNDNAGDCVWADEGHEIMLRTANAGQLYIPPDSSIIGAYSAVTGYVPGNEATDTGTDENAALAYLKSTGIDGHKIDDFGAIDPTNFDHVRWSVQLFGACRLGIMVTDNMIEQFEAGEPWTALGTDQPDGHDVPIVYCDADYAYVITWAREQRIAWSLMADTNFVDEAHAELAFDWIKSQGTAPSGFDLNALDADLKNLGVE